MELNEECEGEERPLKLSPSLAKNSSELLLLKLKEIHRTSQSAVDYVVEGCQTVLEQHLQIAKDNLLHQLADADPSAVPEMIKKAFDNVKLFEGLESEYLQKDYCREHFGVVLSLNNLRRTFCNIFVLFFCLYEPQEIILGEYEDYVVRGSKRMLLTKTDKCVYVPLLETLQQLLCNDEVMRQVSLFGRTPILKYKSTCIF